MKYAIIENNTVTNVVVANAPLADNWIASETAKIGDVWDGTSFTTPSLPLPDTVELASVVRTQRNMLLSDSDWTQVADAPVDAAAWATYRQALRDITVHPNFPYLLDEDWPMKPD